jgi:hypothetical protein
VLRLRMGAVKMSMNPLAAVGLVRNRRGSAAQARPDGGQDRGFPFAASCREGDIITSLLFGQRVAVMIAALFFTALPVIEGENLIALNAQSEAQSLTTRLTDYGFHVAER